MKKEIVLELGFSDFLESVRVYLEYLGGKRCSDEEGYLKIVPGEADIPLLRNLTIQSLTDLGVRLRRRWGGFELRMDILTVRIFADLVNMAPEEYSESLSAWLKKKVAGEWLAISDQEMALPLLSEADTRLEALIASLRRFLRGRNPQNPAV